MTIDSYPKRSRVRSEASGRYTLGGPRLEMHAQRWNPFELDAARVIARRDGVTMSAVLRAALAAFIASDAARATLGEVRDAIVTDADDGDAAPVYGLGAALDA